jgi:hypothetical protein
VLILRIFTILCSDFPLHHKFVKEQADVCNAPYMHSEDAAILSSEYSWFPSFPPGKCQEES